MVTINSRLLLQIDLVWPASLTNSKRTLSVCETHTEAVTMVTELKLIATTA